MRFIIYFLAFFTSYVCFGAKLIKSDQVMDGTVLIGSPSGVGSTADASAQLEVKSTTKGLLPPRMTTAQRDAISSPATGLVVFNTSSTATQFYNGSAWKNIGTSGLTASRALETDASGDITSSDVTSDELNYLDGVTSSIQTQLNAKQSDVISSQGSIAIGDASGNASELTIGAADLVLTSNGTTATWAESGMGANAETVIAVNDFTANSGFETGDTTSWTNSGATFSVQDTTVGDGSYSASWDAAADGNTLTSDAFTIPNKLKNNNVVFCLMYKGGDANIRFIANDGTNDFVDETLSTQTDWDLHCTNTVMPDVSTITLRLEADDDAAVIYADNFAFALAELVNISNISQAELYGFKSWAITTSCAWSKSANNNDLFVADADCDDNTITFDGAAIADASNDGQSPNIRIGDLSSGYKYEVEIVGNNYNTYATTPTNCYYGITDGTTVKTATYSYSTSSATNVHANVFSAVYEYDTSQTDVTFSIIANRSSGGGTCVVATPMLLKVKRFPKESQQAINPSTQMVASGVKIAADAAHNFSTTSASYVVADDADVVSADKTHYGTATITTDESNFGFTMPYLKANTRYKVFANIRLANIYGASATTCAYTIYDGTNELAEGTSYASAGESFINILEGTISYASVQTDKEFTIYAKRVGGGGTCYVGANVVDAEIGIIPLTEGMNAVTLETQWKQYDLTVEGTNWTTTRAVGLPYKDINGVWRLKFNIDGATSSGTRNFYSVTIAGITTSSSVQVISGMSDPATNRAYCSGSTNTCSVEHTNATTTTYRYSGDIELDSKPSWATGVNN